jgi:hypothetical protein
MESNVKYTQISQIGRFLLLLIAGRNIQEEKGKEERIEILQYNSFTHLRRNGR